MAKRSVRFRRFGARSAKSHACSLDLGPDDKTELLKGEAVSGPGWMEISSRRSQRGQYGWEPASSRIKWTTIRP